MAGGRSEGPWAWAQTQAQYIFFETKSGMTSYLPFLVFTDKEFSRYQCHSDFDNKAMILPYEEAVADGVLIHVFEDDLMSK